MSSDKIHVYLSMVKQAKETSSQFWPGVRYFCLYAPGSAVSHEKCAL